MGILQDAQSAINDLTGKDLVASDSLNFLYKIIIW